MTLKQSIPFLILTLSLMGMSCKSVDLRTPYMAENPENLEERGKALLETAKKAMGYDRLAQTQVYEARTVFDWKGFWLLMPMNAFPGNNKENVQLRFATNSFDDQVEYLSGRKKGTVQGLQSWEGYKTERDSDYLKRHEHDRYICWLATYHYLIEAPMHLPQAEIIRYAGTQIVDDIAYDTVYVTWGSEAPNKTYDRMLVYIHPETRFIDLLEVTINDFFLAMPKGLQHATARYERSKTEVGAYLPSQITIQFKTPKPKDRKVYSFSMDEYRFDSFDRERLYPISGLKHYGFSKPESK